MKKILISALFLVFAFGVSAQSLQNFEYSPEDNFEKDLTGGEAFTQEINFSNEADRPVPINFEVKIDGEDYPMSSSGAEFDLSDSTIIIEDYSVYEFWNAVSGDIEGPRFKVLELDDTGDGVPEEILVMESMCKDPSEEEPVFRLGDDDCDFEDVEASGLEFSNLSVDNRPLYDRNSVDGDITRDLVPVDPADMVYDNSTVVPVLHEGVLNEIEDDGEIEASDYSLTPARFDIQTKIFPLDSDYERNNGTGIYRLPYEPSLMISQDADVSISIVFNSSTRIKPDSFTIKTDIFSRPGIPALTETEDIKGGEASVDAGNSSVEVETDEGEEVSVSSYREAAVEPPEPDEEFVGGVGVEVTDSSGEEAEAQGNVSIEYSQDVVDRENLEEASMDVLYYNESSLEWTQEGVEVISRDLEENVVTARVSHFSTYAAFAPQESTDGSEASDSSSGWIDWTPEEEENSTEKSMDNSTGEKDQNITGREASDSEQDSEASEDQQLNETEQSQNVTEESPVVERPENQVTGLFSGQPSDATLPAAVVILLALLLYFYRDALRGFYTGLRSS